MKQTKQSIPLTEFTADSLSIHINSPMTRACLGTLNRPEAEDKKEPAPAPIIPTNYSYDSR